MVHGRRAVGRSRTGGPSIRAPVMIGHDAAELGKRGYRWPLLVNVSEPRTAWRRPGSPRWFAAPAVFAARSIDGDPDQSHDESCCAKQEGHREQDKSGLRDLPACA